MQTGGNTVKNRMIICPNTSCGKIFAKPLKALNFQNALKPYYACPCCLSKVTAKNELIIGKSDESSESEARIDVDVEKHVELPKNTIDCRYHLGYLSERTQKDQIPDDCIVCRDIVDCMLKKMMT